MSQKWDAKLNKLAARTKMNLISSCPICSNALGGKCAEYPSAFDARDLKCDVCGKYRVSKTVLDDNADFRGTALSLLERAALSHLIQTAQTTDHDNLPFIKSEWLREFRRNARLPTPPERARKLVEHIGDYVQRFGHNLEQLEPRDIARIGFFDLANFGIIFRELKDQGVVIGNLAPDISGTFFHPRRMNLTLKGWEEFEKLKSGLTRGGYAFLALQFGDKVLDALISDVLKPSIREQLGFDVFDMRDVARAGIIDNLMREQIRDSAFVIADLTHDNSGAYWEAGYAEGLGKPVIYICEQTKFDEAKTHFDTNHCTTVMWSADNSDEFSKMLIATVRRSLGLFPSS